MPTPCSPLFAAGFDWLEVLLPFLFVAFWIASQVFAMLRRIGGPQPPARRDRPPQLPRPQPVGDVRSELEKQIEEFLRQSSGQQPRRAPQADRVRPQPVTAASPARQPRPTMSPPRGEAEQPAVGTRDARRTTRPATITPSSAAAPLPSAVETVGRHVQDAFAHDLAHSRGGLAQAATATETAPPRTGGLAAELAEMLRSPAATRRAILLREVLERPVDRW